MLTYNKLINTLVIFIFILKLNFLMPANFKKGDYAIVIKPVIDITIEPTINSSFSKDIPLSSVDNNDYLSCPRFHQMLFNEIVKIIDIQNHEILIEVPSCFIQQEQSSKRINIFRTSSDNIMTFSQLKKHNVDFHKIPKSIDFNNENYSEEHITLKNPFYDPKTNNLFSAGTRFVHHNHDEKNFYIYVFNPTNYQFIKTAVPKKLCLHCPSNNKEKIINFVNLLKEWANQKNSFIPYVWGGCSFTSLCDDKNFVNIKKNLANKQLHFYDYPKYKENPKTGFDCSGIIFRAAQICQLPYYFKNSTTIKQNLEPISKNDKLAHGDIIWIPGHVLAISDLDKNLVIEANSYLSGHGKVHEIEISKVFKDIHDFDSLKEAFFQKKQINRLNKKGNIFQKISNFMILKMDSVLSWNKNNNQIQR